LLSLHHPQYPQTVETCSLSGIGRGGGDQQVNKIPESLHPAREKVCWKEVWVWHYRVKGIMRQEVHPVAEYKTESALWKHIVPSIKLLNEGAEKPVLVAATRVTSSLATNLNT